MNLPVYQLIQVKSNSLTELNELLKKDMNLRQPVAINLLHLEEDIQKDFIGLIQNFFISENISFKFPYPIFLVSVHEPSISLMPMVSKLDRLPRFYHQKEGRMNVKESHLADRNRLLQLEVANTDAQALQSEVHSFAVNHRRIYELQIERDFCSQLLKKLTKEVKNG